MLRSNSVLGGLKRLGGGRRPRGSELAGSGSVGFDDEADSGGDDDGPEEDDADDVQLGKWDLSRPGNRDKDGR